MKILKKKEKKERDKNATFTKNFTILLQQILSSRLLQAVIDGEKIISTIGSIVNVSIIKKKKFTTFFTIVELANFY